MEKRNSSLPRMMKKSLVKDQLPFKIRQNLATKEKQNKIQKSVHQAMAKNTVNRAKSFNSPELIFALNDSIRVETIAEQNNFELRYSRQNPFHNKTFHASSFPDRIQRSKKKHYALNQERERALELSKWMNQKLQAIKDKKPITLDDILDYNQTVINFGLGEVIQSVRKRCKEQGQTLKIVWDNTFILFEGLLNVLAKQLKQKEVQMLQNQKYLQKMYLNNLSFANKKNQSLEEHLDLLYERMKKIILWNRSLRKDRFKQEIKIRVRDYRLATYSSALQQAISMLLTESKDPDCLKFAKKIISRLYRDKKAANLEKRERKRNKRLLKREAHDYVHEKSKEFVMNWLKKYSFGQEEDKIENSVYLTQDEKLQIIKISDQNQADQVDIYDYFQTKDAKIQTLNETRQKFVQYEEEIVQKKTKNVGVQTKRIYKLNVGIQTAPKDQQSCSNQKLNSFLNKNEKRLKSNQSQNLIEKQIAFVKNRNIFGSKLNSRQIQKNSQKNSQGHIVFQQFEQKNEVLIDFEDAEDQEHEFIQEWQFKNEVMDFEEKSSLVNDEKMEVESHKKFKKFRFDSQVKQNHQKTYKSLKSVKSIANKDHILDFSNKEKLKQLLAKGVRSKLISQKVITQTDESSAQTYKPKALQKQKFDEIYDKQMKSEYIENKEDMIRTVVRRRSFYKSSRSRKVDSQKTIMYLWYRPNKHHEGKTRKQFNSIDENIYNYFSSLVKTLTLPYNYTKLKIYNQACSLFSSVSIHLSTLQRIVPKNKQFINLSVNAITKFISRLIFDYLRKIRGDLEGISVELERVHYPLSVILVDHMMHKYGLREIAQKKLKDFMEKISNFVGVSERMNFFYRLLGVGEEMMSADELLIYMKCLVYFDVKKTIPIQNISKDFTVQRAMTDRQTVLANVDEIIRQFFREDRRGQVKWKIERYFHIYQLSGMFDIQRIAAMLIDQFIGFKKEEYQSYVSIYRNCQGNFFPNLLKTLQIFYETQTLPPKAGKMMQDIFKSADLLDQNFGKSISEVRFVGLCVRLGFPKFEQIKEKMTKLKNEVVSALGISNQCSNESDELLTKLKKKYGIKISLQKESPDCWLWTWAQIGYQVPLMNASSLLGNLKFINNWCPPL